MNLFRRLLCYFRGHSWDGFATIRGDSIGITCKRCKYFQEL